MNYNLILSRFIQTLKNKSSNQPIVCFKIFYDSNYCKCDCVDYCKYGPTSDTIILLNNYKQNSKQMSQ